MGQIADSYLRYLPFSQQVYEIEIRRLKFRLIIWSVCAALIYAFIFKTFGFSATSYKAVMMLGWIPYAVIFFLEIRQNTLQYIFVLGMSALWIMLQHNCVAIIDAIFFINSTPENVFLFHSAGYIVVSLIFLPFMRKFLTIQTGEMINFAPFFEERPQGRYIAFLPVVIGAGQIFLWADNEVFHSWAERLSRFYLIVVFIFIYKHVLAVAKNFYEQQKTLREKNFFELQVKSLANYNSFIQENQRQINELRSNLHFGYAKLITLLEKSDVQSALDFLNRQETFFESTKIIRFCRAPLINTAISIYMQQANKLGIDFKYKIKLPSKFRTDESDFAILISNLLENAVIASQKQLQNERAISIIINHDGNRCVLDISNKYSAPLKFNKLGFPVTSVEGHGLGMQSVKNFATKYNAQTDFSQSNGEVKFLIYWED